MKITLVLALLGLSLLFAASRPEEAPTGFDDKTNGFVDDATHQADHKAFDDFETVADGLGPLYNAQSCRECHQNPTSGGSSQAPELRAGHLGPNGQFENPEVSIAHGKEVIKGRTLINNRAICPSGAFPSTEIQERVPDIDKIRTLRMSVNLLGDGFVEAVPDATFIQLSRDQCGSSKGKICGQVLYVPIIEAPGETGVGRFGWKDQHASLLSFSGDAYLNEMGITSPLFPDEVTSLCNTATEPNDKPGPDGLTDVDRFARFVRATKAPARDEELAHTPQAKKGGDLFAQIGCATCHVPTLTTAPSGTPINGGKFTVPPALGNKAFHPYSDFLLHDVGTGDGLTVPMIEHYGKRMYSISWKNFSAARYQQGANKIRTAPLWGVRMQPLLMHDGKSLTLRDAILRHRREAARAAKKFRGLGPAGQEALLEFLKSL